MDNFLDDFDISWLTQVPKDANNQESLMDYCGKSESDGWFDPKFESVVSLEEAPESDGTHVLYGNVVCEDITTDEELDKM